MNIMTNRFTIVGMHCASCVGRITSALKAVEGVSDVEVTLVPPAATVASERAISLSELQTAVASVGQYSILELSAVKPDSHHTQPKPAGDSLLPLLVIVSGIVAATLLHTMLIDGWSPHQLMGNFMGWFFAVFSLMKLVNLSGFADAFATYDIIARRSRLYALMYPFVELLLAVAYFTRQAETLTNLTTLALMLVGSIGVAQALRKGSAIQCACLGTWFKLPMTKITLVENLSMALMAVLMLLV